MVPSNNLYNYIFDNPKIVTTTTALTYYTHNITKNIKWDILLVISETGDWLLRPPFDELHELNKLMLGLIVTEDTNLREINSRFCSEKKLFRKMAWWECDREMIIVANESGPIFSIYYTNILRYPHISPVFLNRSDSLAALDTFITYWKKASGQSTANNFELETENELLMFLSEFKYERNDKEMIDFLKINPQSPQSDETPKAE